MLKFLRYFFKNRFNKFIIYQKYDHKIISKKKQ